MNIGVIGGGSLGLMWTSRLMLAGFSPLLIVRSVEQKNLIMREGLHYMEAGQSYLLHPHVASIEDELVDFLEFVWITVKQTQLDALLPYIKRHLSTNTLLLTLQNGVGHDARLSQVASNGQILLGVTTDGALRHQPNSIERTGVGETWIGIKGENRAPGRIKEWIDKLSHAGIPLQWDEEILARLWRKCIINSVINPLTALLQVRNGELLGSEHAKNVMKALLNEAIQVTLAEGYQYSPNILQEIEDICRNTFYNYSSMLQDLRAHRQTEIHYINGMIVHYGEIHQIPTPIHRLLVEMILAKEDLLED